MEDLLLELGLVAFLCSLYLAPLLRDLFRRFGFVDQPDGLRKQHSLAVPRVGGVAIAVSYVAAMGLLALAVPPLLDMALAAFPGFWKLFFAASVVFAVGLLDDLVQLRPWQKLTGQLLAAGIAYMAGVQIHVIQGHPLQDWLCAPVTIIWLLACTNAFNLIDGLDGLAAGVGLFATITMLLAALIDHNINLALVTTPLAGALLGFLRYNFNPASLFLGDCGSLLIGFLLGCYGVLWSHKSATLLGMTAPLMTLAIPLLDAGVSILRRFLRKQPIFEADREHIHHMLLAKGLTPKRVAIILYAICGAAAALSLLQNSVQNQFRGLILVLFCAGAWVGIQHLGYVEFAMAKRLIFRGAFRRIIDTQARLDRFEKTLLQAHSIEQCSEEIITWSRDLGFRSVRLRLDGAVSETVFSPHAGAPYCQLRIPLPGGRYVNLEHDLTEGLDPTILGGFANVIDRTLRVRILAAHLEAPLERIEPSLSGTAHN